MGKVNDENVKTGQQETNEPWKKPDHSDHHPDKDSPGPRPRRAEDNKTYCDLASQSRLLCPFSTAGRLGNVRYFRQRGETKTS